MGDLAITTVNVAAWGSWIMPALVSGSVYCAVAPCRRAGGGCRRARDDDPEPVPAKLAAGGAPQPPAGDGSHSTTGRPAMGIQVRAAVRYPDGACRREHPAAGVERADERLADGKRDELGQRQAEKDTTAGEE